MKGRKNRPAGQAKTRPKVREPQKPYIELDDGKNSERLAKAVVGMFSLSPEALEAVRLAAKRR